MKKVIKLIVNYVISFIIYIVEYFEYLNYKEISENDVYSSHDLLDFSLVSDSDSEKKNKIISVHRCKRDYLYTLYFPNGQKIRCTLDHGLICNEYEYGMVLDEWGKCKEDDCVTRHDIEVKVGNILFGSNEYRVKCDISQTNKYQPVIKWKKSLLKYSTFDITTDGNHVYKANGVYVHNCVTYDINVNIYDKNTDKRNDVPIFELYYKNLKKMSFLDKIEYKLHKLLYKLEKR